MCLPATAPAQAQILMQSRSREEGAMLSDVTTMAEWETPASISPQIATRDSYP